MLRLNVQNWLRDSEWRVCVTMMCEIKLKGNKQRIVSLTVLYRRGKLKKQNSIYIASFKIRGLPKTDVRDYEIVYGDSLKANSAQ